MNARVTVGSMQLATPLLLASGYITETPDFFLASQPQGCAGMVTRSLKEHVPPERAQVPAPRYVVYGDGSMLNCEWGNERPWQSWVDGGVAKVKATGCPIIVSLSGRDLKGCMRLIRVFDTLGVDAYEINVSCSHSGALHGNLNVDLEHLTRVVQTVRDVTTTPIWVKLSYSTMLLPMARRAEELGADAIVCTNSIGPGMLIDTRTAKPKLGIAGGGGGVTGKAIFPIALWCVHQLAQAVRIPVVGSGGVSTADEVIQMLMAGAHAVQLYTEPALRGPVAFTRIMNDLERFMADHAEFTSVQDLVGLTIGRTRTHAFVSPPPVVHADKCTGCNLCIPACAFDAISMVARAGGPALAVIADNCVSCNACVGVCPKKFGAITSVF